MVSNYAGRAASEMYCWPASRKLWLAIRPELTNMFKFMYIYIYIYIRLQNNILWTARGEASDEHDRTNGGRAKLLHLQNGI